MRAGVPRNGFIGRIANRRDHGRARTFGQLHGADSDRTGPTLHQDGPPFDRTRRVNTAMRGDGGYAEACALLKGHTVGKRHDL